MCDRRYQESIESIIKNALNYQHVLVVGSEVMREAGDHADIVNRFLSERYSEEYAEDGNKYYDYPAIIEKYPQEFSASLLNKQLRTLLETGCFRIVLTTTFDPLLENALREMWESRGETLRVLDIWEEGLNSDLSERELGRNSNPATMQPTLYYVFGRAKDRAVNNHKKFVLSDNDRIEVVSRWMKNPPKNLVNYIRSRRLLALGCKLNDWLFRFFWYSLIGDVNRLKNGEVAVTLDDNDNEECRLHRYLERQVRLFVAPDARKFLHIINDILYTPEVVSERIMQARKEGGIFLSYRSESFNDVYRLFLRLTAKGYNVWFDNKRLEGADKYRNKITEAIDHCKIFIPVIDDRLLSAYQADVEKEHQRFYYKDEWLRAVKRSEDSSQQMSILPVVLHGCNRDSRLEYLPDWLNGLQMKDPDVEFNALCQKIDELLKGINNNE